MSFSTPTTEFTYERPEVQNARVLAPTQLTQFEIDAMKEEQRRLTYFTDKTNEELNQRQEEELFINLSLVNLFQNLSTTLITILNEILVINQDTPFNEIVLIFVKGNRLVYLGILMLMIALGIYIVEITQ